MELLKGYLKKYYDSKLEHYKNEAIARGEVEVFHDYERHPDTGAVLADNSYCDEEKLDEVAKDILINDLFCGFYPLDELDIDEDDQGKILAEIKEDELEQFIRNYLEEYSEKKN